MIIVMSSILFANVNIVFTCVFCLHKIVAKILAYMMPEYTAVFSLP